MKKILITRRLLKSNEERASKIWNVKLNATDEVYSQGELIKLSNHVFYRVFNNWRGQPMELLTPTSNNSTTQVD